MLIELCSHAADARGVSRCRTHSNAQICGCYGPCLHAKASPAYHAPGAAVNAANRWHGRASTLTATALEQGQHGGRTLDRSTILCHATQVGESDLMPCAVSAAGE